MRETDQIIREMRQLYTPLYHWHRKKGQEAFHAKYGHSADSHGEWFRKYLDLCHRMPVPRQAEPHQMVEIAQAVIFGCMQWSCNTQLDDVSMFQIAQRIRELGSMLSDLEKQQHVATERERLRLLHNRSHEPQSIRIRFPRPPESPEEYAELASLAYSDVTSNVMNLGGSVALADTNRHHEDAIQRAEDGIGAVLTFRNAPALHFEEVNTAYSLVSHAMSGAVSILSVRIGV